MSPVVFAVERLSLIRVKVCGVSGVVGSGELVSV